MIRESYPALEVQEHLEAGFKHTEIHGCGKFHDLERPVHGVRYPKYEWNRALLLKFLEAQKTFPHAMQVGTDNVTALTRGIIFEYRQLLTPERMKVNTWRGRNASTSTSR